MAFKGAEGHENRKPRARPWAQEGKPCGSTVASELSPLGGEKQAMMDVWEVSLENLEPLRTPPDMRPNRMEQLGG